MAVELISATPISNADAGIFTNANVIRGILKEAVGKCEVDSAASIDSIYRLNRVPSNARISQVLLSCDAITSGAGDIGVYKTAHDGGAVVDVDHFASAQSIATALVHSDITHEADPADGAAGFGKADTEKMLWESLGLTTDPKIEYDIAITLTAAATAAGTLGLKTRFAI